MDNCIASLIDERRNKETRPGRLGAALYLVAFLFIGAAVSGIAIDAQAADARPADSPALETLKAAEQNVDELLQSTGDSKR